jgi:hypothetical protein
VTPVAVPVRIEVLLVADHGIVDAVGGTDREVVAREAVAIEVEHHVDAVDLLLEIPLHALARSRNGSGLGIAERKRETVRRREDPRLGAM